MFKKSTFALVAAIAAATISAPAFAQSVDHTGTLAASYYNADGKQVMGSWTPAAQAANRGPAAQGSGLYAHAEVAAPIGQASSGYDGSIASQR